LTDFGGKTSIFSHPVYLFLREFSLQDSRGGSVFAVTIRLILICVQFMINAHRFAGLKTSIY
ncbi:TPA: hypothetical protein ACF23L_004573, partial [Escherichia coli]